MVGKGTFIHEVAKDRLWRDYVSREENHQTYWAGEAQFVKGSLSPEKKNILRNVDVGGDFDATILLGTARSSGSATSPKTPMRTTVTTTNTNPNAPSNLLLRQLHMTAIENTQMEAKQLETLQNYKLNYSSRAMLNNANGITSEGEEGRKALPPMSPTNNRHSPISPNATTTGRVGSFVEKERTLNSNYCSYYAGRDIGIHHYHYSPPVRSCHGIHEAIEEGSANPPTPFQPYSTTTSTTNTATATNLKLSNLPPLQTHLISRGDSTSQPLSPLSASRVYAEELEDQCRVVSPKRHFTEHGLLSPHMGKRLASASGRRGYGQRIASTTNESYVVRPSVELNEGSKHGYRKW